MHNYADKTLYHVNSQLFLSVLYGMTNEDRYNGFMQYLWVLHKTREDKCNWKSAHTVSIIGHRTMPADLLNLLLSGQYA